MSLTKERITDVSSLFGFNVQQMWESVYDGVKSLTRNSGKTGTLEYSFITPTILALSKISDDQVDSLFDIIQESKNVLIWNLSGKDPPSRLLERFNHQVVSPAWNSLGQFTQIPSLISLFQICYGLKVWLDLNDRNIAVIYCTNGKSRTGILIAAFLKYCELFSNSSLAFEYFCNIRYQNAPSLAASYRLFFENIDNCVSRQGFGNTTTMLLKQIVISNLLVDVIPCVEIYDINGRCFSSSLSEKPPHWSIESGDGIFSVETIVTGDFAIYCKFGGVHATGNSKGMLIFKYQNHISFVADVLNLKYSDVDFNPDYSSFIDAELFRLQIVFEASSFQAKLPFEPTNSSFQSGILELSKAHYVTPSPIVASSLSSERSSYVDICLQLCNNDRSKSLELLSKLSSSKVVMDPLYSVFHEVECDDPSITLDSLASDQFPLYSNDDVKPVADEIKSPSRGNICCICNEDVDEYQLIPCSSCQKYYHTSCCGFRRIPEEKRAGDKFNRDKYVSNHFGRFLCPTCKKNDAHYHQRSGSSEIFAASNLGALSPVRSPCRAEQQALFLNLLASNNLSLSSFDKMPKDEQRNVIFRISTPQGSQESSVGSSSPMPVHSPISRLTTTISTPKRNDATHEIKKNDSSATKKASMTPKDRKAFMDSILQKRNNPQSSSLNDNLNEGNKNDSSAMKKSTVAPQDNRALMDSIRQNLSNTSSSVRKNELDTINTNEEEKNTMKSSIINNLKENSLQPDIPKASIASTNVVEKPDDLKINAINPRSALMAMIAKRSEPPSSDNSVVETKPKSEASNNDQVALRDDPKYSKYFKMLKMGLPKEAVGHKMVSEGVVSSIEEGLKILELDPSAPVPSSVAEGQSSSKEQTSKKIAVKDHPKYAKFFKMAKVGISNEAIKLKIKSENLNEDVIDMKGDELVDENDDLLKSSNNTTATAMVKASEHPKYSKYFRMLKVGLPPGAVKSKMTQDGLDPDIIDRNPDEMIPLDETDPSKAVNEEKVMIKDHPLYSKYFKMVKVGLPKEAVAVKMQNEGLVGDWIYKDPDELIPLHTRDSSSSSAKQVKESRPSKAPNRKKRLHWKPVDAKNISHDSLWHEDIGNDISLDEAEFNQLFVDSGENSKAKSSASAPQKKKSQVIAVIDMKRAQNASIALARIKVPFDELRAKIESMDDKFFSIDQLVALQEYLPTREEIDSLSKFNGDESKLGPAERYMKTMMTCPNASKHIQCMMFKLQYFHRVVECKSVLTKIENACDDVKMSNRLKQVLKTVLRVGNQMNDGFSSQHVGFTLDSLLKLSSLKAFDNKTSILQYVITLIDRHNPDYLKFPEDLKNVTDASRLQIDLVGNEKQNLRQGLNKCIEFLKEFQSSNPPKTPGDKGPNASPMTPHQAPQSLHEANHTPSPSQRTLTGVEAMEVFFKKARHILDELDKVYDGVKGKFGSVLNYFGEDPMMPSHEFFSTLAKFSQEFVSTCEVVERLRKQEEKRKAQQAKNSQKTSDDSNNNSNNNNTNSSSGRNLGADLSESTGNISSNNNSNHNNNSNNNNGVVIDGKSTTEPSISSVQDFKSSLASQLQARKGRRASII